MRHRVRRLESGQDPLELRERLERVERFAFYERAKQAFGVVVTSETRLYGNIIISKGVIAPTRAA